MRDPGEAWNRPPRGCFFGGEPQPIKVLWSCEVAELIAEGTSTPVVTASSAVLSATRSGTRDSIVARAVEPSASATEIGLPEPKNFNSLEALTAPLSVANVTQTQSLATVDPNAAEPVVTKDPISPDKPLNAPLDPGDVSRSAAVAKGPADPAKAKQKAAQESPVDKATADKASIRTDKDEKGVDGLTE